MATLEDKILGEKLHYYCSSSEGEDESERSDDEEEKCPNAEAGSNIPSKINEWTGTSTNTGPKGVIEDWRRYKQLEIENRKEMAKERIALAKKLTLTAKTEHEETESNQTKNLTDELDELLDEEFLMEYQKQRMQELMAQLNRVPKFGKIIDLNSGDEFLDAIDKEDSAVTVVIHVYNNVAACETMDGCLKLLAADYANVKFCRIPASSVGLSRHFNIDGVPALLVYKKGQMVGNFVQLATELGNDFYATDVERFLIEYGILPEK